MENYLDYMTIIYSKKTGELYSASVGFQGMSIFDKFESELSTIFSEMTTVYNDVVIQSPQKFKLDFNTNQIIRLEDNNFVPPIESVDFKNDINKLKTEQMEQNLNISLTEDAVNLILMGNGMANSLSSEEDELNKNNKTGGIGMGSYLGNQIYKGKLDYNEVIAKYPQFKEEIDAFLEMRVAMDGLNVK